MPHTKENYLHPTEHQLRLKMDTVPCWPVSTRSCASFLKSRKKLCNKFYLAQSVPTQHRKLTEGRKCINKSQSLPKENRKYIIDSKYLTLE